MADPQVLAVLDTLPVAEFAAVMHLNEDDVRAVTLAGVRRALTSGGSVDNIRTVMEGAIADRKARRP